MNFIGDGNALILVESPIANCAFMNGIYTGIGPAAIIYTIDKGQAKNVEEVNLVKMPVN